MSPSSSLLSAPLRLRGTSNKKIPFLFSWTVPDSGPPAVQLQVIVLPSPDLYSSPPDVFSSSMPMFHSHRHHSGSGPYFPGLLQWTIGWNAQLWPCMTVCWKPPVNPVKITCAISLWSLSAPASLSGTDPLSLVSTSLHVHSSRTSCFSFLMNS